MKKALLCIALVSVMVFGFAATAMADHSPDFYFDFAQGSEMMNNTTFQSIFPASWNTSVTAEINNGSWALGTATPHSGYSQSTAKCEVCHAIHRAPTLGTSNFGTPNLGTGTSSSKYAASPWTAEASTQMLLKTTTGRACLYCHVVAAPTKMYGGDVNMSIANANSAGGWNDLYAHTNGCISCHAVHGANTFKSADGTVDPYILKYKGVKNLGTIALKVQPEVYGTTYNAAGTAQTEAGSLYTSYANMLTGTLSATALAAHVTPKAAAITAQCSICHASYAVGEETINADYSNAELFQPATWSSANGSTAKIWVGSSAYPVVALPHPGAPGLTYTAGTPTAPTGSAGSLILAYKNHPMNAGTTGFNGAGASAFFGNAITAGTPILVSSAGASTCQSCHNAPETAVDGAYYTQSFPHYTPGYYKFMAAQNQAAFDTPTTIAQVLGGAQAFYSNGGHPAVMNDGYCTKCHGQVGVDY